MAAPRYEGRAAWETFAAVLLFAVAFVRIISGINYLRDGGQINELSNSVFGQHLWVWGIWDLCLAALAFAAAVSLLGGGAFGRAIAYVWAVWAIVQSFLIFGPAPWFAAATIALAALVIYGLASTSAEQGAPR
jgi:hypothetical protein